MPAGVYHESYRTDERVFQTWFVRFWLAVFLVACGVLAVCLVDLVLGAANLRGIEVARALPQEVFAGSRSVGHHGDPCL